MTLRHLFLLILTVAGIAYLQWFMVPPPAQVSAARLPEEPWEIPGQINFDAKDALAALAGISLWGKAAENAQPVPLNDPEWRFLATLAHGAERYVIIQIEGQPEQKLAPGDTLPGGSQILAIENDHLCVLVEGQKRRLPIYPHGRLGATMPAPETEPPAPPVPRPRWRKS